MKKTFHRHHISFQFESIIWTLATCVFYKLALFKAAVLARAVGVNIDIGFFILSIDSSAFSYTICDYIFLSLLCLIVLQGIGFTYAIKESKAD